MKMENDSGIWELFIPEVEEGAMYKYVISTQVGIHCTRLILMVFGLRKDPEMLQG